MILTVIVECRSDRKRSGRSSKFATRTGRSHKSDKILFSCDQDRSKPPRGSQESCRVAICEGMVIGEAAFLDKTRTRLLQQAEEALRIANAGECDDGRSGEPTRLHRRHLMCR
jgi:hypothetical protein